MNPTRVSLVVLATVVIFAAGVVTGGLLVRKTGTVQITQPFWNRFDVTRRAVEEMHRRGELTPQQRARIDIIIRDNQELIGEYFSILEPDVQQVFRKMRESIREELTPEQQKHFEELAKRRLGKTADRRSSEKFEGGPGKPPSGRLDGEKPRPTRRDGESVNP